MKRLLLILSLTPLFLNGQNTYSGLYGKYKHNWTMRINSDSSIILIENIDTYGYEEYIGTIKKKNDTLFNITAKLTFAQNCCRAIGDSVMYVTVDTSFQNKIQNITLTYTDKHTVNFPLKKRTQFAIPIDKSSYNSTPQKNTLFVSAEHINPINNTEVKTQYKIGDEYGLEIYTEEEIVFNVVIKKNTIRKIEKGPIENFILTKKSSARAGNVK